MSCLSTHSCAEILLAYSWDHSQISFHSLELLSIIHISETSPTPFFHFGMRRVGVFACGGFNSESI